MAPPAQAKSPGRYLDHAGGRLLDLPEKEKKGERGKKEEKEEEKGEEEDYTIIKVVSLILQEWS